MPRKPTYEELERRVKKLETQAIKRKASEERIEHFNFVLRSIRNVNRLITKEKDRTRLLKAACDNLIANHGYFNAWIVILEESGKILMTAEAGMGKDFLPMAKKLKRNELPNCAQRALTQSNVLVTEDPVSACTDCPLAKNYRGRGAITGRLEYEGKVYGVLSASIPSEFTPDKEEQSLFKEVVENIAFALYNIDLEEERKRIQKELQEREERFSVIFENAPVLMDSFDEDGHCILWNKECEKTFGWTMKDINTCDNLISLFYPDPEIRKQVMETVTSKPERVFREWHPKTKDGSELVTLWANFRLPDGAIINIGYDITENRKTEKALQKSEERLLQIVQGSSVPTFVIDKKHTVTHWNKACVNLTGISANEIIGTQNQWMAFYSERRPAMADLIVDNASTEEMTKHYGEKCRKSAVIEGAYEAEDFFPDLGKRGKWVFFTAAPLRDDEEKVIGAIETLQDTSETKKLEHLLRIQDKMTSLGRVAAGIAHEIRNPLSGVNIYLNTLERICDRGENLDKVREILGQIQSASNRIESVIKRVMDFSKPSEPKFVLTDLNQPIEEAIKLSYVTFRKRGIKIEKALAEDLPSCKADSGMIEQVILNMVTNAAEAMEKVDGDKRIGVSSSLQNNHIILKISDSGTGVPLELKEKILDPFYTTKDGSTGIGLSIAYRIVTDHGGTLEVSTSKWGGAKFTIEIPIERGKDQA